MTEPKKYIPLVSSETGMIEFTIRALILGIVMAVIFGSANVYLALRAGFTVAAVYPAAIISMAILRLMKGSILEENFARTTGAISEVIAGAVVFTIPAFYIAGIWTKFNTLDNYLFTSLSIFLGGSLGVLFAALIRKIMIENAELPFPEGLVAAEIHKAGKNDNAGAKFLFSALGIGGFIYALGQFNFYATTWQKFIGFTKTVINLKSSGDVAVQGGMVLNAPAVSPAFLGIGYVIGPKLASLVFSGGVMAWGLFVPILLYFLAPNILSQWQVSHPNQIPLADDWIGWATTVWKLVVRPIAVGGMLVGAASTLYKIRKSLTDGLKKSIGDVKKSALDRHVYARVDQDLNFKWIAAGTSLIAILTSFLYYHLSQNLMATIIAVTTVIIFGFLFSAVAGYLVGLIGSSNAPFSGLMLSVLIISSLLLISLGISGKQGISIAISIAVIACLCFGTAGGILQDLKASHILGGTPWRLQFGTIIVIAALSFILFLPLIILHQGDINAGKMATPTYEGGFGSVKLPAPQAGLVALVSTGILSGHMAWPLIIVGIFLGLGFILMQVKSPMLASIGMYLPLETTFAIFIGGAIKALFDRLSIKKQLNDNQKNRAENVGILIAAGLIAGEALMGLILSSFAFFNIPLFKIFSHPSFTISLLMFIFIAWYLIKIPLKKAMKADQP